MVISPLLAYFFMFHCVLCIFFHYDYITEIYNVDFVLLHLSLLLKALLYGLSIEVAEWFAVPRDVSILFLLVLCFGLVANSLSAVVWLRQVTTKSGAFFLGCLSLADMLYCLVLSLLFLIIEQSNKQGCNIYGIVEVILLTAGISR